MSGWPPPTSLLPPVVVASTRFRRHVPYSYTTACIPTSSFDPIACTGLLAPAAKLLTVAGLLALSLPVAAASAAAVFLSDPERWCCTHAEAVGRQGGRPRLLQLHRLRAAAQDLRVNHIVRCQIRNRIDGNPPSRRGRRRASLRHLHGHGLGGVRGWSSPSPTGPCGEAFWPQRWEEED